MPLGGDLSTKLRYILFEGSSDEIERFRKLATEAVGCGLRHTVDLAEQNRLGITQQVAEQRASLSKFEQLLQYVEAVGIKPTVPVKELKSARDAVNQAASLRKSADTAAGAIVSGCIPRADIAEQLARIQEALTYCGDVTACNLGEQIEEWLISDQCVSRTSILQDLGEKCSAALHEESIARNKADRLLVLDKSQWCGAEFELAPIASLRDRAFHAATCPEQLDKQIAILAIEEEAAQAGLGELIRTWQKTGERYAGISWVIKSAFYRSAADKLMREHPVLAKHTGHTHEQARQRFRHLDKEMMEINRRALAATIHKRPIPQGTRAQSTKNYTNYEMLSYQTGLQQPRIALRRLFGQAGAAIRALKPCIMMSPMSVAQHLEAGKHVFDLLVIDEASQMRPEDALGAMLRCSQAVIVGDPEQLPPTEFFMASNDESEEDAEDAPEESILELGRRSWRPMRMLEVHYRSRHQSLIAYSNQEFYSDRLLVYPSPAITDPDFGVSCRRIEGAYETGQGRNQVEARMIVDEAAILGVECDGATYHSSKSARDRDRLRQEVLEGLNWRIHRVWSTDWYRDPEQEFSRLVQTIKRYQSAA